MVKYTVWNRNVYPECENTKFTRELNTYGFDEYGIGEELLFPIRLNGKPGENQETNLATYLVKYKEFEKNDVKITKVQDKEGFNNNIILLETFLVLDSRYFDISFFEFFVRKIGCQISFLVSAWFTV